MNHKQLELAGGNAYDAFCFQPLKRCLTLHRVGSRFCFSFRVKHQKVAAIRKEYIRIARGKSRWKEIGLTVAKGTDLGGLPVRKKRFLGPSA